MSGKWKTCTARRKILVIAAILAAFIVLGGFAVHPLLEVSGLMENRKSESSGGLCGSISGQSLALRCILAPY